MAADDLYVPPPRPVAIRRTAGPLAIAKLLTGPVTFALAGGGAHGAVQWGLFQSLSETDILADALIGTSAGALTGAIMAEDAIAGLSRLTYVWSQLDLQDIMGDDWLSIVRSATSGKTSLIENASEAEALESILAARSFAELDVPFAAVATDLATGHAVAHDEGALIPALLASSAIPGVLPPVSIEGRVYIDGLASANLPAKLAVHRGAGTVVVLGTGSRAVPVDVTTSAAKIASRVNAILSDAQRRAQLCIAGRHVPVLVLPTPNDLGRAMDFSGTIMAAAKAYELGRDYLADLAQQYGSTLEPGLYARPNEVAMDPETFELLKPVI